MIRTAIITDESYNPPDKEEREGIAEELIEHGLDIVVTYEGRDFSRIPSLDVDLLVVDFGGLVVSYSSPAGDYMRLVQKWADEHPSGFVFLWSTMTGDILAGWLRDFDDAKGWYSEVVWPANIRPLDKGYTIAAYGEGDWGDWRDESWRMARVFYGLTPEVEHLYKPLLVDPA